MQGRTWSPVASGDYQASDYIDEGSVGQGIYESGVSAAGDVVVGTDYIGDFAMVPGVLE